MSRLCSVMLVTMAACLAPAAALAEDDVPTGQAPAASSAPVSLGADGARCRWAGDCASQVCANEQCVAPTCSDGVRNGTESATDCGGPCGKCRDYEVCKVDADCASGICGEYALTFTPGKAADDARYIRDDDKGPFRRDFRCVPPGTCDDYVRNGHETGVDCGGPCAKCADGERCLGGGDCESGLCANNVCVAGGACRNLVKDGQETDVDCGGKQCGRCSLNKACRSDDDCESRLCVEGSCRMPSPRASDGIDTRINFTITDENMLVKPGETNPNVPGLRIDRPNAFGILFFDNYDTRYTGYENLSHIVFYKRYDYSWESRRNKVTRFTAEAGLALRLLQFSDVNVSTIDDSSYIRLALDFDSRRTPSNLSLTVFPMSADRMRLGYSYRLSWGGNPIFFKFNPDLPASATPPVNSAPSPGLRLQYTSEHFSLWGGFKTSTLLNKNPTVADLQAIYGVLGGLSFEGQVARRDTAAPVYLRFDLNGGYFGRGNNPNFYPTQVVGPGDCVTTNSCNYPDFPVWTAGGSAQLSLWSGLPPSLSLDYQLYRNDPTTAARFMAKPIYRPGFNWLVQAEFTYLATAVQDFDNPSSTTRQWGYAGDVNVRLQSGHTRFKLDASMRSLEFMLVNQPSFVPYTSFPDGSTVSPDRFVSLGVDYHIQRAGLTIGPTVGIDFPASIRPPNAIPQLCGNTGGSLCTPSTVVVRGEGDFSILPQQDAGGKPVESVPVVAAKLVAREDFLDYFAAILDLYYSHDGNQTHLTKAPGGEFIRDFNHPDVLGFNLTLQARF